MGIIETYKAMIAEIKKNFGEMVSGNKYWDRVLKGNKEKVEGCEIER